MLQQLNKIYFIFGGLLYFLYLFFITSEYIPLYIMHYFIFMSYAFIINFISKKGDTFFTKANLTTIIFLYSFLIVILYNLVSYSYNKNLFVFSEKDAIFYYYESMRMTSLSFSNSIVEYLSNQSLDDLGIVLICSTLYRFIDSKLFLSFFYLLIGIVTAQSIFRISSHFMSLKFAFICSVAYNLSSFVLWFHASGLKESFMCMLIVTFFDRYYLYLKSKNILHLILGSILIGAILLFRTAILFFIIFAIVLGILLKKRKGITGSIIIMSSFIAFLGLYRVLPSMYDRFLMGGDFNRLLLSRQSMIFIRTDLTYAVNLLALLIGPLPTISPNIKELLSFYAPGLLYKVLLSMFFWFGVLKILKSKVNIMYPLIFYAFLQMIALFVILEGLELRKSLPHFFVIYIIAFWFLEKCDLQKMRNKRAAFSLASAAILLMTLVWNVRSSFL